MNTTCTVPLQAEQGNIHSNRTGLFRPRAFEELGRRLGDFFRGSNFYSLWTFADLETFVPKVEIAEDESSIRVDAELPGIDEKDIDITLTTDTLTIRGEKREHTEGKNEEIFCTERSYGTFSRMIPLSKVVDMERVEASYRNGVLHISLPKLGSERVYRKVEVQH
jgi:HSP20 family protein